MFLINLSNVIDILANDDCPFLRHSCFRKKAFAVFRGCNRRARAQCKLKHVPFWGILVFRKSLLLFLGGAIKPCFGGKMGLMHVPKSGFLVFRKKVLPKKGHKTAQNGPKRPKTACACPFFGHSCFRKKTFAEKGTC